MRYEVVVVGGSFAGQSAAMQLARARRRVLLVDSGLPRNRFAAASHGFFGHDGLAPGEMIRNAARQLAAYPTVDLIEGEVVAAEPDGDGFAVTLAGGRVAWGARLILATGVRDTLPEIPGVRERWGHTVFHCPFCHGYEVADRPLGVLATMPMSVHQGVMLPDWGPTTYFTQGEFEPTAEEIAQLEARGVRIERSPIVELLGAAPALDGVRLADGRIARIEGILTATRVSQASPLAESLGCAIETGPLGPFVQVDDIKRTTVPGVYAAGDLAGQMHTVTLATAAGAMAGAGAYRSLLEGAIARGLASEAA